MNQNITVAVFGATGKAGRYLIRQLVCRGFRIKALTRNPAKLEDQSPLIEKIIGDVTDPESVFALLKGCTVVISTLGQTKGENPVFSTAAQNVTEAMKVLHLNRYIMLTGLTLDTQADKKSLRTRMKSFTMKMLFRKIIADKQKEYRILQESNLDWTVVRVPFIELTDEKRSINISLSDCKGAKISSTDLADFIIDQINTEDYFRKAPFIWNN